MTEPEKKFVRLRAARFWPAYPWLRDYAIGAGGEVAAKFTAVEADAKIFVDPSELELERVSRALARTLEIVPASFEDWIAQSGKEIGA